MEELSVLPIDCLAVHGRDATRVVGGARRSPGLPGSAVSPRARRFAPRRSPRCQARRAPRPRRTRPCPPAPAAAGLRPAARAAPRRCRVAAAIPADQVVAGKRSTRRRASTAASSRVPASICVRSVGGCLAVAARGRREQFAVASAQPRRPGPAALRAASAARRWLRRSGSARTLARHARRRLRQRARGARDVEVLRRRKASSPAAPAWARHRPATPSAGTAAYNCLRAIMACSNARAAPSVSAAVLSRSRCVREVRDRAPCSRLGLPVARPCCCRDCESWPRTLRRPSDDPCPASSRGWTGGTACHLGLAVPAGGGRARAPGSSGSAPHRRCPGHHACASGGTPWRADAVPSASAARPLPSSSHPRLLR